ncbi:MAG: hypothetical protein DYG89_44075 [Caldilinea sp. CFX5]|nr:hypothetical protein [Caldilinea sp. CFX5]
MLVQVSTILDCPAEKAWQEVHTTRLLQYVAAPVLAFAPVDPPTLPEEWAEGKYQVAMKLFGLLPFGKQWIGIIKPPTDKTAHPQRYEVIDNGSGDIVSRWYHRIIIQATADGRTQYTDAVEISAGMLTIFIWLFAQFFYRHRQRRWRKLIKNGFRY